MTRDEIKQEIAKCIGIETAELNDDSGIGRTQGWDSLAHVEILERLEGISGISISVDESIFSESLSDLVSIFEK